MKVIDTNFGNLSVSISGDENILTSRNKNEKVIWRKSITGTSGRDLKDLNFNKNPLEYNSVATVVHMYSEGERLTLYLREDGEFMFYFHSW